jgi:hypothetical protein
MTTDELNEFNKKFKNNKTNKNENENGDNRLENPDDYKKFEVDIYNQFSDTKFTNEQFNKIFEHIKLQDGELDQVIEKSLIHKTTDGFRGYNSADFGNCALVSSFNGLLISGDTFGDNGSGYWGSGYSDYKFSYNRAKNPNSRIIVKSDVKQHKQTKVNTEEISKYKQARSNLAYTNTHGNFSQQQNYLDKKIYEDLTQQEHIDEMIVKKNLSQYDNDTIQKALAGELETSKTYKSVLHKYIKD